MQEMDVVNIEIWAMCVGETPHLARKSMDYVARFFDFAKEFLSLTTDVESRWTPSFCLVR